MVTTVSHTAMFFMLSSSARMSFAAMGAHVPFSIRPTVRFWKLLVLRWLPLIREVIRAFGGNVELGGGLRTMADIALRIEAGVTRCIIGTAAIEHPELVKEACRAFPGQIAVGLDAKDGFVATRGWVETSALTAAEVALRMRDMGVATLIYTDISRDGMMQGPNFAATKRLIDKTQMDIIGSGGVSSISDLLKLQEIGCAGAILGRAMYEGAFTVPDALEAIQTADKGE